MEVLDLGEEEDITLSPTEELKCRARNLNPGDEFFDRKARALVKAKEGKFKVFDAYGLPCYPLNPEHRKVRNGLHYNPHIVLNSPSSLGPKREVAWLTTTNFWH
eukprot:5715505-Amphidinium_carterae.1